MAENKGDVRERKLELAARPDTKVVFTRTPESHMLFLIMSQADICIGTLKNRLFQEGYSSEEVKELLEEFYAECRGLEKVVEKISIKCGLRYKKAKELK